MPKNTDTDPQTIRKKQAKQSALFSSLLMIGSAIFALVLNKAFHVTGFGSVVLVTVAVMNMGAVIPVCILLKQRLKEIEGGEEDDASQY